MPRHDSTLAINRGGSALALTPSPIASLFFASEKISWRGFVKYWLHFATRGDRVILVVALVLAFSMFIITRGKWR
jgi:hypothetical protein